MTSMELNLLERFILRSTSYLYEQSQKSRIARSLYDLVKLISIGPSFKHKGVPPVDYVGQAASDLIYSKLQSESPCLVARFGATELASLTWYYLHRYRHPTRRVWQYFSGYSRPFWWVRMRLLNNSGFFPGKRAYIERFCELLLQDIPWIDVLGSYLPEEEVFAHLLGRAAKVRLQDLEPYYHEFPWSAALAGKTVLVVHPFAETIYQQYQRKEFLFKDPNILPDFDLKVFKSIQTIAGNKCGFPDWFSALDWMCDKISNINFDISIIGAGAYGLPLAAHVKRLGKKAVHLGGATQILFGIRGKRWDSRPFYQQLYNDYWVRPLPHETPSHSRQVEGGCYW